MPRLSARGGSLGLVRRSTLDARRATRAGRGWLVAARRLAHSFARVDSPTNRPSKSRSASASAFSAALRRPPEAATAARERRQLEQLRRHKRRRRRLLARLPSCSPELALKRLLEAAAAPTTTPPPIGMDESLSARSKFCADGGLSRAAERAARSEPSAGLSLWARPGRSLRKPN